MIKTLTILTTLTAYCTICIAQEFWRLDESLGTKVKSVEPLVSNLTPPVNVKGVEIFREGGTVAVLLQDAVGKYFLFSLEKKYDAGTGDFTARHIYVGVVYPTENPESRYGIRTQLPIDGVEEKALLKLLQGWKETEVKADRRVSLSRILELKGQKLREAIQGLPKSDYNDLLVFGLIRDLESRNKPPAVTIEQAEALVDRDKARKLADEFVDDIINNRKKSLLRKFDDEYGRSPFVGKENEPRDAEGSLQDDLDYIASVHEKVLSCTYKEERVRWIKYADGHRRPVRDIKYSCRTKKGNEDNPHLIIEVVPQGNRLAVMEFSMVISPDGY